MNATRPLLACLVLCCLTSPLVAQEEAVQARAASITFGGRLHTQFQTSSVEGADADLFFRRARFIADVRINDFVSARVQPDFSGSDIALEDAYVRLTFSPRWQVQAGQFKRPYSAFDLASSTDLPLIERDGRIEGLDACPGVGRVCSFSRFTEGLRFDGRDQGVMVSGRAGGVSWAAAVTNGEGTNAGDVNDAKSFTGRVEYDAGVADFGVFGGLHDHIVDAGLPGDAEYGSSAGVDVELGTWRDGLHVLGALAGGENWRAGPGASFLSAQVLATFYVPVASSRVAGVEPLFRLSWGDPDTDVEDDAGLLLTPGVMLYFVGKNGISANLDYYAPDGDADGEWSLKLQSYLYF